MGSGYSYHDYYDYFHSWDSVVVPPSEPDPTDEETLRVTEVDLQVERNVKEHHTEEYDITDKENEELNPEGPKLVVRRGDPFTIKIKFSRPYERKSDDLRLVFQTGDNPQRARGSHVEFVLSDKDLPGQWGAKLVVKEENAIEVKVFTPPGCIVGKWKFLVHVLKKKDNDVSLFRYSHKDPVYVLFNPWCGEDTVFLADAARRDEYVLNEKGVIWRGSHYNFSGKPWIFGQFSDNVLDCCMYLMDKIKLDMKDRGNPIIVARQMSAVVNSCDMDGVLEGNWSGSYSGGTPPLSWVGSKAILEQYYKQKTPVKYGQCWVFSGVLTTVLRALGIPARSVTNFESAHDVDATLTMDTVFDDNLDRVHYNNDSVWNFHVWNEAWMTRPDLPQGYGGWQACDSTPQESSEGMFRCGPCPVLAIKEGKVNLHYDGPFIFAEVSADRVYWRKKGDQFILISVQRGTVGKKMSTVSLSGDREDVTGNYKFEEGSPREREAFHTAKKHTNVHRTAAMTPGKQVELKLFYPADKTFVGGNFTLSVQAHNMTSLPRTVTGKVIVKTMLYNATAGEIVTSRPVNMSLEPGQTEEFEIQVTEEDYYSKLKDMCILTLAAMVEVQESGETSLESGELRLRKPHLQITGPSSAQQKEEFEVEVSFTNPLSSQLTNCYLEWESDGIKDGVKKDLSNVGPKETFTQTLKLKPTKRGRKEVALSFNSKELEDINGTFKIHVTR